MAQLPERTHQPFKVCWIKLSAWYHRIFKILQETWLWTIRKYPKSEVFEMHSSLYAPVLYGIELLHNQHALYFTNTNFSSILSCAFWTDIKWSQPTLWSKLKIASSSFQNCVQYPCLSPSSLLNLYIIPDVITHTTWVK